MSRTAIERAARVADRRKRKALKRAKAAVINRDDITRSIQRAIASEAEEIAGAIRKLRP